MIWIARKLPSNINYGLKTLRKTLIKKRKRKRPSKRHKGGLLKQNKKNSNTTTEKHKKTRNLNQKILKFIGVVY